jgi:hypothetical protein
VGCVGAAFELGTIGLLFPFPQLASTIATTITPSHLSNALRSTGRRSRLMTSCSAIAVPEEAEPFPTYRLIPAQQKRLSGPDPKPRTICISHVSYVIIVFYF